MVGVGEALQIIREEKGMTLKEISHKTNISTHALQALETDDYRQIPGKFHYLNYLRAYLGALNIEEKGFLEMYKSHIEGIPFKKEDAGAGYFTKLKYYRFKKKNTLPYFLLMLILLLIIAYILLFNPLNISWGEIIKNNPNKSSGGIIATPKVCAKSEHLRRIR
jgi:cytoskeletal protein RodZ